jgi:hypothetical protein
MKSLSQLMDEAYNLSLDCAYSEFSSEGTCFTPRDLPDTAADLVFGWADGLMHQHYHKHAEGRCAPQAYIDFDPHQWEQRVVEDIDAMAALLETLTPSVRLTTAEMRARGYRLP